MNLDALVLALQKDEGHNVKGGRHVLYKCPADKWTIGYGRNLEDNGISQPEAFDLLMSDALRSLREAASLVPNWAQLNDVRSNVIANMAFNMGRARLAKFVKFLAAVNEARYADAAKEMIDSLWYVQVGGRAVRLAEEMRTGVA